MNRLDTGIARFPGQGKVDLLPDESMAPGITAPEIASMRVDFSPRCRR